MHYQQTSQIISKNKFNQILDQVFDFINKLLNGDSTLQTMTKLRVTVRGEGAFHRNRFKASYGAFQMRLSSLIIRQVYNVDLHYWNRQYSTTPIFDSVTLNR
jgi:hypothetical protein